MLIDVLLVLDELVLHHLLRDIDCAEDETIFHAARRQGVRVVGACGGRGACGSCAVRVRDGSVDAQEGTRSRKWLHACRTRPRSDCKIEVAPRSLARIVRADVTSTIRRWRRAMPASSRTTSSWRKRRLIDNVSRFRARAARLAAIRSKRSTSPPRANCRAFCATIRWSARIALPRDRDRRRRAAGRPGLGLAIDLGTTNVVGFLVDSRNRQAVAEPRHRKSAGRMGRRSRQPDQLRNRRPASTSTNCAERPSRHQCARPRSAPAVGSRRRDIVDVAVCGNTAMQHLLLGLPVRQLGRAPFVAALRDATDFRARDLGLEFAPGASVCMRRPMSAASSAPIMSRRCSRHARYGAPATTSLVMDIGTNTEISLVHDGGILSASCPSGPALEGGHISCGMRAADGAIEKVWDDDGRLKIATIGDKPPVGICGSGILDAIAAALRVGVARLERTHSRWASRRRGGRRKARYSPRA